MARKWQDISRISREVDGIAKDVLWTPDTPTFLEARARRQAARERPPASYTQVRTAIHKVAPEGRRSYGAAGSGVRPGGGASIIDFEDLGRAGARTQTRHGQPGRGGSYYGGRGGYRYPVNTQAWGTVSDAAGGGRGGAYDAWREDGYEGSRAARGSAAGRARPSRGAAASRSRGRGGVSGGVGARARDDRGTQWSTRYEDEIAPEDFDGEEAGSSRLTLRGRLDKLRHDARRRKADRDFARDYDDAPASGEGGPRAALYEGKMGRSHHRSARMQARGSQAGAFGGWAFPSIPLPGFLLGKLPMAAVFTVLCVALFTVVVFPGAQDYYLQMRTNAQLEAEYQAVLERNEELQQRVSSLQTDEGIEQLAHESLGWVREGERSVSVMADGSSDIGSGSSVESSSIPVGSVPAPTTWYSPALDALFGYGG